MTQISKRISAVVLGGALLAAGATWAVTAAQNNEPKEPKATKNAVALAIDDRPVARDLRMTTSFAPIVKKVGPSVVKISTFTKMKDQQMNGGQFGDDPLFGYLFGQRNRPSRPGGGRRGLNTPIQRGIG